VVVLAQDKVIRSAMKLFQTPPKSCRGASASDRRVAGHRFFLVQFNDRLKPGLAEQLRQMRLSSCPLRPAATRFMSKFNNVSPRVSGH